MISCCTRERQIDAISFDYVLSRCNLRCDWSIICFPVSASGPVNPARIDRVCNWATIFFHSVCHETCLIRVVLEMEVGAAETVTAAKEPNSPQVLTLAF
jgi:hypothetical protein